MMKFRTDLLYALIAFESVLVAIASILLYPVWVLAIAVMAFIFSAVELVVTIVKMRKHSYDEESGKYSYKFPWGSFAVYAALLLCLTAMIVLSFEMLFGYALVALTLLLIGLLIIAICLNVRLMKVICGLLVAVLAVALISYGTAHLVHYGVNLNPGCLVEETVSEEETDSSDDANSSDDITSGDENTSSDDITSGDENTSGDDITSGDESTSGDDITSGDENTSGEDTTPVVTLKIDCPETMTYGVPVTVKLEGIDADNLKYGNEDFISIVKVSDSEVVLTLVGIVNDAGEVQIVPAAGYITITDSVSGTNVQIRIVD